MAIPKRMSLKGTFSSGSFVAFLEWFGENIHETNVLSLEELNRLVHLFVLVLPSFQEKLIQRTGHYKFVRRGPTLSGVGVGVGGWGGIIEGTTCLMNITNKIFIDFKI